MSTEAGAAAVPLRAMASGPLTGRIRVPPDRTIAHHALMLGALALGETTIEGLPPSDELLAVAAALRAFGATVAFEPQGTWRVKGVGVGGFLEPEGVVECGPAAVPLLLGLIASQALAATLTGDAALRNRPLGRVLEPLRRIGAQVIARSRERAPLSIQGADTPLPIDCRLPAPLAEIKAAVLFAGLNTPGVTSVIEPVPTRDHSERILGAFGAALEIDRDGEGARIVRIEGQRDLKPQRLTMPGDPGAAAFAIIAALVVEGSDITIEAVLVNPLRLGLIEVLGDMGADITLDNHRIAGGEPVADVRVRASRLKGVTVPAARVSQMIDDTPALAVAAAFAEGRTVIEGLGGLRQEQPALLPALVAGLAANGVTLEEGPESLVVTGSPRPAGGGAVATRGDPRIALGLVVLGLGAAADVTIDDLAPDATLFPGFTAAMNGLGARIQPLDPDTP